MLIKLSTHQLDSWGNLLDSIRWELQNSKMDLSSINQYNNDIDDAIEEMQVQFPAAEEARSLRDEAVLHLGAAPIAAVGDLLTLVRQIAGTTFVYTAEAGMVVIKKLLEESKAVWQVTDPDGSEPSGVNFPG
jgi:hypothetical protein